MAKDEFDLDQHAIVEASAGTGKTHTIIEIVLRLMCERKVPITDILIVTFTEKATGELKGRLRGKLEEAAQKEDEFSPRAIAALNVLDQASVFTIHGFCQRVLREHAFANKQDADAELVDDADLLKQSLREVQRSQWPRELQDSLASTLRIADFDGDWDKPVLDLAKSFQPACGHRLRPEAGAIGAEFGALEEVIRKAHAKIEKHAGRCPLEQVGNHPWSDGFLKLDANSKWLDSRHRNLLVPFLRWIMDPTSKLQAVASLTAFMHDAREVSSFGTHGFGLLTTNLGKKAQPQLPTLCPGLQDAVVEMEILQRREDLAHVTFFLSTWTVRAVHTHLDAYKQERGLLSFNDLLTHLDRALHEDSASSKPVLRALRERYRYAIVDEFQDTDPIQWRIFKRIFVDGKGPQRLIIVGDPKQAIFGFRGADLQAYLDAVRELKSNHKGKSYPLATNWRSDSGMLNALNALFEKGEWFQGTGIDYVKVGPPPAEKRNHVLTVDSSDRKALTIVKLPDTEKLSEARRRYARFVAREIRRLLSGKDSMLQVQEKGRAPRPLRAGDICILVARRSETGFLLEALREQRLPYTFYKQTGLWQSDEATHLSLVLKAVARLDESAVRGALLTWFFRLAPEEVARAVDSLSNHPAMNLIRRWRTSAANRKWAELFHSILHDTGVLYFDPSEPAADRRRSNLHHLANALQEEAYRRDLDLLDLLNHFEELRANDTGGDANNQPIETDREKVKIMTIHASKGLEFPVVFLAGGFTMKQQAAFLRYREEKNLVFDFRTKDADALARHRQEQDDELRRLYYVALTRAIFKLYVPEIIKAEGKTSLHSPGPVINILGAALQKILDFDKTDGVGVCDVPRARQRSERHLEDVKPPQIVEASKAQPVGELFPSVQIETRRERTWIRSFTSLHRHTTAVAPSYQEEPLPGDDETPPIEDDPFRGPVFGEMLHDILEHIDYLKVGAANEPEALDADCRNVIEVTRLRHWPKLSGRLSADPEMPAVCREILTRMVWNTLHTPLPEVGPLWKLPKRDRLHELQFHFPEVPNAQSNYLTGFMDLVFRKDGRYFLLDWKSNLLADGYSPTALHTAMAEMDYVRQYRLYAVALNRWLTRRQPDFKFERDFGGVFYLFLRGLNGHDDSAGVFFHRPTKAEMELKRILADVRS